jgi:hypothetical protein
MEDATKVIHSLKLEADKVGWATEIANALSKLQAETTKTATEVVK